jgi:hypothetical protein
MRTRGSCLQVGFDFMQLGQIDSRGQQRTHTATRQQEPHDKPVVHSPSPIRAGPKQPKLPHPLKLPCARFTTLSVLLVLLAHYRSIRADVKKTPIVSKTRTDFFQKSENARKGPATRKAKCHSLGCRRLPHEFHVAVHRLSQLRIHLVRDSHHVGQQQAEIQRIQIALQRAENRHL